MNLDLTKTALAKQLGISRSSLYYRHKLPDKDELLRLEIERVMKFHPSYGHRRVAMDLGINRKRILRVMNKFNLKPARRCRAPSKSLDTGVNKNKTPCVTSSWSPVMPNVLWTGDFTYIQFQGKHIYLAVVQDRYTAFVHGVRVMTHHGSELVIATMSDALKNTKVTPVWFHSDLGSEYTCLEFEQLLETENIKISTSPKASPWRNASQESFFGRFKIEFEQPECYSTLGELISAIYQHIHYYNYHRIHTRLKTSPATFIENIKKASVAKTYPTTSSYPHTHRH